MFSVERWDFYCHQCKRKHLYGHRTNRSSLSDRTSVFIRYEYQLCLFLCGTYGSAYCLHQQSIRTQWSVQIWHLPPQLYEYRQQPGAKSLFPFMGWTHAGFKKQNYPFLSVTLRKTARGKDFQSKDGRFGTLSGWYSIKYF